MLYDRVYLQDGRYQCTVQANGTMDTFAGSGTLGNWDRHKISFGQPGKEVSLLAVQGPFNPAQLRSGQPLRLPLPQAFFDADFFPLIEESGLRGHAALQLVNGDWNNPIKEAAKTVLKQHKAGLEGAQTNGSPIQKAKWAEVFVLDSLAADAMKLCVTMDPRAAGLVDHLRQTNLTRLAGNVPDTFLNEWLALDLPDFSAESWESLREKRDSATGVSFRAMLATIEAQVFAEAGNLKTKEDLEALVRKHLFKEVVDELMARRTSPGEATVSLALNFTPVGLLGNVKEFWQALKEKRSWINLLKKK